VGTRLGFSLDKGASPGTLSPSDEQPIQNFRWTDRDQREVRYRVVPVIGTPDKLSEAGAELTGSAWTGWVSRRTGQNQGCRAFFNATFSWQDRGRVFRKRGIDGEEAMLHELRRRHADLRGYLGGGLRQTLLELLTGAKLTDRRVYGALSDLDDPDLISALKSLGKNLRLILGSASVRLASKKGSGSDRRAKLCGELGAASVQVYEHLKRTAGVVRSNFFVLCDRWGTPMSVWTGSAAWTTRALCLHPNNGILMESVPLARAYLDRWDQLLDARNARPRRSARSGSPQFTFASAGCRSLCGILRLAATGI